MPFLITQVFMLIVLAGAGGAAIAYWWVRRQFEDVTEEVTRLRAEQRARDLSPVIEAIEAIPPADMGAVASALEELARRVAALEGGRAAALPPTNGLAAEAATEPASANLLASASYGPPDDLEQIRGVGPKLAGLLHDVGVYYFWQIAEWTEADVEAVDARLEAFKGRIHRDGWIEQARGLSAGRPDDAPARPSAAP